jgi:hypothetical protein
VAEQDTAERVDELHQWRRLRALELGLPPKAARLFADSELSPHDLEDLVAKGCDPVTGLAILLP